LHTSASIWYSPIWLIASQGQVSAHNPQAEHFSLLILYKIITSCIKTAAGRHAAGGPPENVYS
jgi:hypothetical protein